MITLSDYEYDHLIANIDRYIVIAREMGYESVLLDLYNLAFESKISFQKHTCADLMMFVLALLRDAGYTFSNADGDPVIEIEL